MCGRQLAALSALATVSLMSGAVAAGGMSPRTIRYARNALTVRVARMPVADVLAEIARQANAEIRGDLGDLGDTSTEFEAEPLSTALHRLLGEKSFALIYGPGGQLRTISVFGASEVTEVGAAPVAASVRPPAVAAPVDRPNPVARWEEMVARVSVLRVSGPLAVALGSDRASFRDVMNAMVRNEDPAVRSDALIASMHVLATDAEIRTALLDLWPVLDPQKTRFQTLTGGPSWRRLLVAVASYQP